MHKEKRDVTFVSTKEKTLRLNFGSQRHLEGGEKSRASVDTSNHLVCSFRISPFPRDILAGNRYALRGWLVYLWHLSHPAAHSRQSVSVVDQVGMSILPVQVPLSSPKWSQKRILNVGFQGSWGKEIISEPLRPSLFLLSIFRANFRETKLEMNA